MCLRTFDVKFLQLQSNLSSFLQLFQESADIRLPPLPSKQIENLYQHWLCRWPVWHATPAGMGWLPIMSRANNFFVFDGGMVAITALDPALMNSITFAIASACIATKAQLTIVWCPPCQLQTN